MEQEQKKELDAYIKARQAQGATTIEIANELKGAGWNNADIDVGMKDLGAQTQGTQDTFAYVVEPTEEKKPMISEETERKISTVLGSLIILLAATIAGSIVWWYAFSYEVPEVVDDGKVVAQLQERRNVEGNATTTASSTLLSDHEEKEVIEKNIVSFFQSWIEIENKDDREYIYQESPYITEKLSETLEEIYASTSTDYFGSNPVICAQDIPSTFHVESVTGDDEKAIAIVYTSWFEKWGVIEFTVLNVDGQWLIDAIECKDAVRRNSIDGNI